MCKEDWIHFQLAKAAREEEKTCFCVFFLVRPQELKLKIKVLRTGKSKYLAF